MIGSKLLLAGSLLLLAPVRAACNCKYIFGDPGAHVHNGWYAAQLL